MLNIFHLNISFLLITIFITIFALAIIISKNPVHSVFYLVLVFILSTLLFLLLKVEFIALLFLIVYVGAIIVLFLFVVMMLNVRILEINERVISYIPIAFIIVLIFFSLLISLLVINFVPEAKQISFKSFNLFNIYTYLIEKLSILNYFTYETVKYNYFLNLTNYTDLNLLSFVLYTQYIYIFFLAGAILFIAMIGSIVLTLNALNLDPTKSIKLSKQQDLYQQTNKSLIETLRFVNKKK